MNDKPRKGDRVAFTDKDGYLKYPDQLPPPGTRGTIVHAYEDMLLIEWDSFELGKATFCFFSRVILIKPIAPEKLYEGVLL